MLFTGEVRGYHAPEYIKVEYSSFAKADVEVGDYNHENGKQHISKERSSLVIQNAQPKDAGEYTCRIMIRSTDEINVTHTLTVQKAVLSVQTVWNVALPFL